MKRFLQSLFGLILLSLSVGPAFAVDRVLIPSRTDNALAVGSTVMLEWELPRYRAVNLSLGGSEVPFAENIPNKGWYRWTITQDIEADLKNQRILVTPVSGGKPVASKAFTLKAWTAEERYRGRIQHYDADLSDRPQVTYPAEGETIGPDMMPNLRWDDPDNLLSDRIQIHLRAHHHPGPLEAWLRGNSGEFTLPESERSGFEKDCGSEPGCYFVVRSNTHKERRITSGHFTFGEAAVADNYLVSVATESPAQGTEFEITWTDQGEVPYPVRVDLLKGDAYYLTFAESIGSTPGEDNTYSYLVPYTVAAGEDYRVEINAVGKPHHKGTSDAFAIAGTGDKALSINAPKGPWVLAKRRTDGQITWKKPGRIKEIRVDLYKGDRRIRTVVDESKKRQLRWPVTRSLPTGEDYTLRIQDLADETSYAFSEPFCIRQSTENCDGTPKASAAKVTGDTGSVSIVEVSATTSPPAIYDAADADRDGIITRQEWSTWDCAQRAVVSSDSFTFRNAKRIRFEPTPGAVDGTGELIPLASCPDPEESTSPTVLEPVVASASGCGEGTIELAGHCVPDAWCPGVDALVLSDRSRTLNDAMDYSGKPRVCDKYLLRDESDDERDIGAWLEEWNRWMKLEPRLKGLYEFIVNHRLDPFFGVAEHCIEKEPGSGVCARTEQCIVAPARQRAQRLVTLLSENEDCQSSSRAIRQCSSLLEQSSRIAEIPLCTFWHTTINIAQGFDLQWQATLVDTVWQMLRELKNTAPGAVNKWPSGEKLVELMRLESSGDGLSPLFALVDNLKLDTFKTRLPGENLRLEHGFWWPDDALITDPDVIEWLREHDPTAAAHAEFILLTSDYLKAHFHKKTKTELLLDGDDPHKVDDQPYLVDPNDPLSDLTIADRSLESETMRGFGPRFFHGLKRFSLRSEREEVIATGIGLAGSPEEELAQRVSPKPPEQFFCGPGTEKKGNLCVAGGAYCPAWQVAGISDGCGFCPGGLYPNDNQTACEDKNCGRQEIWNVTTQRCENFRDRRRHAWIQMRMQAGFDGYGNKLIEPQEKQYKKLQAQVKIFAEQESRERDYVSIVALTTTNGNQHTSEDFLASLGIADLSSETGYVNYRQSVVKRDQKYDPREKQQYWKQEPIWTKIDRDSVYRLTQHFKGEEYIDDTAVLEGLLHRGMQAGKKLPKGEEKSAVYALNLSAHGIGTRVGGVDIRELREIIARQMKGVPLDLITFDSCRMGAYEALLMLEDRTKWVVAHTTNTPAEGWNPEGIGLAILGEEAENKKGMLVDAGKGMRVSEMIDHLLSEVSTQKEGEVLQKVSLHITENIRFDSVVAYRMDRFADFREAFDDVLRALTLELKVKPDTTVEKLTTISKVETNHVIGQWGHVGFYHVDGFLEQLKIYFPRDTHTYIFELVNRAERKLIALTQKPEEALDQARMIFGWCGDDGSTKSCEPKIFRDDSVYSDPALKALYDFNQAMRDANNLRT